MSSRISQLARTSLQADFQAHQQMGKKKTIKKIARDLHLRG